MPHAFVYISNAYTAGSSFLVLSQAVICLRPMQHVIARDRTFCRPKIFWLSLCLLTVAN